MLHLARHHGNSCHLAFALALILLAGIAHAADRSADPIVLTGADVASLEGIAPGDLVAFRYEGGWVQIPVQVDERAVINFTDVYHGLSGYGNYSRLDYTDAGTYAGADPDPVLDADDEIVFMAKDAGGPTPAFSEPAGVVADSGLMITVVDPLGGDDTYVYLFQQSGALDPAAGEQYVAYTFNLLAGEYKANYHFNAGPNPEDSSIVTPYYAKHFSDRWKCDGLEIYAGSASGVDILDRHKNLFGPGVCGRSEDTFSAGEGAFIINKSGPVRAIRSYVGCNSGPRTQRQHFFYEGREDISTFLRVHAIGGVMDFMDYSDNAVGMTYYSDVDGRGALIDGVEETLTQGAVQWELVTGAQGSLVILRDLVTNLADPSYTSYYCDDVTPSVTQCTGDTFAYGSSGLYFNHAIANTDPVVSPFYLFNCDLSIFYHAPGIAPAEAAESRIGFDSPLTAQASAWSSGGDADGDGVANATDAFPYRADESQDADGDGLGDNFERVIVDAVSDDAIATIEDVLAGDDFDSDGATNAEEFERGTNPVDPADAVPVATATGAMILFGALLSLSLCVIRRRPAIDQEATL